MLNCRLGRIFPRWGPDGLLENSTLALKVQQLARSCISYPKRRSGGRAGPCRLQTDLACIFVVWKYVPVINIYWPTYSFRLWRWIEEWTRINKNIINHFHIELMTQSCQKVKGGTKKKEKHGPIQPLRSGLLGPFMWHCVGELWSQFDEHRQPIKTVQTSALLVLRDSCVLCFPLSWPVQIASWIRRLQAGSSSTSMKLAIDAVCNAAV